MEPDRPAVSTRPTGLAAVLLAAAACGVVLFASYDRMWGDTFLNLYAGRWIVEHGVPHTDPFTVYGDGRAWINSQWAANVAYYGAYVVGGYAAVTRTSIAALVVAFAALALLLRARGASPLAVVAGTLWALLVASQLVFARAQNLVFPLFLALTWLILDDDRRAWEGARRPWRTVLALGGLLVAWTNLHGSALMAACFCAAYAAWNVLRPRGSSRVPWLVLLVAAPLSLLATPYGLELFESHLAVFGSDALQADTTEWASVATPIGLVQTGLPALVAIVALVIGWRRRHDLQPPLLAGVALLLVASLLQARFVVWLGIVEVLLIGDLLARRERPARPTSRLVERTIQGAAVACLAMVAFQLTRTGDEHQLRHSPVAAVDAAWDEGHERFDEPVFLGDLDSSAVLLWRHPDAAGAVLFDPRLEIYESSELARWFRFKQAREDDWFELAAEADVVIAADFWRPRLARRLAEQPGTLIRRDDGVVLLRE